MVKPKFLFLSSIVVVIVGFMYLVVFAGIPYQDAPPDLVARYGFHSSIGNTLVQIGVVLMAVSGIWWLVNLIGRRRS